MTLKMIDIDPKKWKEFKKWAINRDMTIKDALDKILTKVLKGEYKIKKR